MFLGGILMLGFRSSLFIGDKKTFSAQWPEPEDAEQIDQEN